VAASVHCLKGAGASSAPSKSATDTDGIIMCVGVASLVLLWLRVTMGVGPFCTDDIRESEFPVNSESAIISVLLYCIPCCADSLNNCTVKVVGPDQQVGHMCSLIFLL